LYDPDDVTLTEPTFAEVGGGDVVLVLGYPQAGPHAGVFAGSVGRVLGEEEAHAAIDMLQDAGDEEGAIAYDPAAEMLLEARASVGMSGGGVFDVAGRQVGVLVRASDVHDGRQIVRAVRMTHIVIAVEKAFNLLDAATQAAVEPFMEQP
jgi:hypothetical protein